VVIEIKPGITLIKMRQYSIPMGAWEVAHHLQRLKLWYPETLSICLEHSLAASSEGRHQWLPPNAGSPGRQPSSSDCTQWFLAHTPCWPWYQQREPASCAGTQKDAFFCVQLAPVSQPIFAFQ
jgi:hypothetical protein